MPPPRVVGVPSSRVIPLRAVGCKQNCLVESNAPTVQFLIAEQLVLKQLKIIGIFLMLENCFIEFLPEFTLIQKQARMIAETL
jgi:hypothetical protein